jgi:isocitrate lyase
LPDQSMHEKTAVTDLINEIYTSLRQADEVDLNDLFAELKAADNDVARQAVIAKIDGFESYVRPIIADIDAGFGNVHATYLLAKELIKAGACWMVRSPCRARTLLRSSALFVWRLKNWAWMTA